MDDKEKQEDSSRPELSSQAHRIRPDLKISVSGARRKPSKKGTLFAGRSSKLSKNKLHNEKRSDTVKAKKGALFMAVIFGINLLFIILSGQGGEFIQALDHTEPNWIVAALVVMVFYTTFATLAYVIAASLDPGCPVGIRDCISVEANGALFGNLTPSNSGAVPAQIYRLTQTGLDVGEASAIQFTRFIMFQLGEIIIAAVMLWLKFDFFLATDGDFILINMVVFVIMGCQVAGLLAVCLFPRFVLKLCTRLLRFIAHRGWLRPEKLKELLSFLNEQVSVYSKAFKEAFRHGWSLLLTLVVTFCQLLCLYAVPWFVLHALGKDADFLTCLAAAAMVQMLANSVPLPGGTGGVEAGFIFFFGPIFGEVAAAGFIIWRLVTFYLPTLVSLPLCALKSKSHTSIYTRLKRIFR